MADESDRTADEADRTADKTREARLRRLAADMGLALRKSTTRDRNRMDYGCYRIVDAKTGHNVAGTYPYAYSLDLDAVEEALVGMLDIRPESLSPRRAETEPQQPPAGDAKWDR